MPTTPTLRECIFDRNDVYPWPIMFMDEVITHDIATIAKGKRVGMIVEEYVNGHLYHYVHKKEINDLAESILDELKQNPSFFEQTLAEVYRLSQELETFGKRLPPHPDTLSDQGLIDLIKAYVHALKELRVWGWIPALIDGLEKPLLSQACLAALKQDMPTESEEEINRIYSLFTTPVIPSEIQKAEIAKYTLVMEAGEALTPFLSASDAEEGLRAIAEPWRQRIEEYLRDYNWISFNYTGPVLTTDMLQRSLQTINPEQARQEIDALASHQEATRSGQAEVQKQHVFSPQTGHLLRIAAEFLRLKEYRKAIYQRSYVAMELVLAVLADRLGCSVKEAKFLCLDEMASALADPSAYRAQLKARTHYAVVLVENGRSTCFEGEEASLVADQHRMKQVIDKQVRELKGQVAFPGSVRGTARLVLTPKDMPKLQRGDILVSAATNPDLLPAMKRAGAIVTDTGGIISHAAVVSRELHIPCVVGTKVATKVISDGDILYVDAHTGQVNIL